jgi:hypothetical protein
MEITWLSASIDLPEAQFEQGAQFWARVTSSRLSERRGDDGDYRTLIPAVGDAYVHVQETRSSENTIHLDVHVSDIAAARSTAVGLGASVISATEWSVMESPAGFVFCFVSDRGDQHVPPRVEEPEPHHLDQVSIDVPAALFDTECDFWQSLLGWELRRGRLEEFAVFVRPTGIPLRIILQRLGADDTDVRARAHLDVAAGDHRETIADAHAAIGATHIRTETHWVTMMDPTGAAYCLTARNPESGTLPE